MKTHHDSQDSDPFTCVRYLYMHNRSALHRAALSGHEAAAKALILAGADVGVLDADERGPLSLAVR